jgi:chaperone required for assembly of F1-ATPase
MEANLVASHKPDHEALFTPATRYLTMRDIFEDIFQNQPLDPTEAARRNMRPNLRTRFYEQAQAGEWDEKGNTGFPVLLDAKPVRTPARQLLSAPARTLAEAIAAEWMAQERAVDPATMPLTRLANAIIDGVAVAPQPVAAEIRRYIGNDLLFYRASEPEGLVARQRQHWDPVIGWARDVLGARFVLAEGLMPVRQNPEAVAAAAAVLPAGVETKDHWRLGAISVVTSLTGSALLALALAAGLLTADEAWAAAHVDEDWNLEFWGRDELTLQQRTYRFAEMQAAAIVLDALR